MFINTLFLLVFLSNCFSLKSVFAAEKENTRSFSELDHESLTSQWQNSDYDLIRTEGTCDICYAEYPDIFAIQGCVRFGDTHGMCEECFKMRILQAAHPLHPGAGFFGEGKDGDGTDHELKDNTFHHCSFTVARFMRYVESLKEEDQLDWEFAKKRFKEDEEVGNGPQYFCSTCKGLKLSYEQIDRMNQADEEIQTSCFGCQAEFRGARDGCSIQYLPKHQGCFFSQSYCFICKETQINLEIVFDGSSKKGKNGKCSKSWRDSEDDHPRGSYSKCICISDVTISD